MKVDIDEADISGRTSLHLAILSCEPRLIRIVCNLTVDKNKRDAQGLTALALAVEKHKWKAAWVLLEAGADLSVRNWRGLDALELAVENGGDLDLIQLLLRCGVSITLSGSDNNFLPSLPSVIHRAAFVGRSGEIMEALLNNFAGTPGFYKIINYIDEWNGTPLHYAVDGRHEEVVRLLLGPGANPHLLDKKALQVLTEGYRG